MVERLHFEDEIRKNKVKSFFLIVIIFVFFVALGSVIALFFDPTYFFVIMIVSIVISISYILISYYNSAKIAITSVRAKPADRMKHMKLIHAVENMALASGLPAPKVYVMQSEQINAFASGRNPENAVICVTTGALQKLDKHELEGVIAHEMAHVANFDIRFMTITAVLVGLISIAAEIFLRSLWMGSSSNEDRGRAGVILIIIGIIFAIIAPLLANLVSLAISRKREFTADATGVKFTRYPDGLKDALKKIKHEHVSAQDAKRYPKAVAPLFISDPFKKKFRDAFSTHPDIDERIKKLERM